MKKFEFNISTLFSSYKRWSGGVLIDLILMKLSVRSLGIGTVLLVSFDSIWKNNRGLTVFCHKSRQVYNDFLKSLK